MVTACGAESRISKKYAAFIEEAKTHSVFQALPIALIPGFIVGDLLFGLE